MADNDKQLTWEQYGMQLTSQAQQWFMATVNDPKYGLKMPADYDAGNEIEAAMFEIINNVKDSKNCPALQCCTRESILSAIRYMATQGLSVTKKQGYFIVFGDKLSFLRSYFGTVAVLKRFFPDYEIVANVLYEGDSYTYGTDPIYQYNFIENVQSSLENRDKPIVAAYGYIIDKKTGKRIYGCVMTKKEIDKNWAKGKTHNVQNDFPQEMAKRTLINRMCKLFVNTSSGLPTVQVEAFNQTTANEYEDNLTNITPPETEIEKQKILRGKSKGQEGLKALLATASKEEPEKEPEAPSSPLPIEPDDGLKDEAPQDLFDSEIDDYGNQIPF